MQFERKMYVLKKFSKLVLHFRLEKKFISGRFCAAIYLALSSSFGKQNNIESLVFASWGKESTLLRTQLVR